MLVFANLHLSSAATAASSLAAAEIAQAIGAWSGPGAVVLAGGTFDFSGEPVDVLGALDAHGALRDALREFSAAPGRRVVILAGNCDAWLAQPGVSAVLRARVGAEVAPALVAELLTAGGVRRARIEAGDRPDGSATVSGPRRAARRVTSVWPTSSRGCGGAAPVAGWPG